MFDQDKSISELWQETFDEVGPGAASTAASGTAHDARAQACK